MFDYPHFQFSLKEIRNEEFFSRVDFYSEIRVTLCKISEKSSEKLYKVLSQYISEELRHTDRKTSCYFYIMICNDTYTLTHTYTQQYKHILVICYTDL